MPTTTILLLLNRRPIKPGVGTWLSQCEERGPSQCSEQPTSRQCAESGLFSGAKPTSERPTPSRFRLPIKCGLLRRRRRSTKDHLEAQNTASPSPTAQGGTPVFISVFDLYNGNVRDMLGDGSRTRKASVKVRCDDSKEVYLENVSEHKVHSASHAEELVGNANAAAYHAATSMGDIRSRAHFVIQIRVGGAEAENVADLEGTPASSKLLFVRLCGSETVPSNFNPSTGSTINVSLMALGTVFKKLLEARSGQAKSVHIPYRATPLTLLLRDTLESRGPFLLVSCLGPADTQETNTIHTMKFAQVACNIKLNGKKRAKRNE